MRLGSWTVVAALAVAPASGAAQGRIAKADCSAAANVYEQLKCKEGGVIAQEGLVTERLRGTVIEQVLERHNLKGMHERVVGKMVREHGRAASAHARTDPKHFKDAVKKNQRGPAAPCPLRPLENADGDPIATDRFAAVSDFTKECKPSAKPGNKFECARLCTEEEPLPPPEGSEEAEIAEGLVQSYDDMETTLVEMNDRLAELPASTSAARFAPAAAGSCADIQNPPAALETAAKVLKIADVALQAAAKIADKLCGQTVVVGAVAMGFGGGGGGNASAVCAVIETASAVTSSASAAVEIALEFLRDDVQAATFACLQSTIEQVGTVQASVGQVQTTLDQSTAALALQIADLTAALADTRKALHQSIADAEGRLGSRIVAAQDEARVHHYDLVLLMSTPQGLRPDFPQGTGGK